MVRVLLTAALVAATVWASEGAKEEGGIYTRCTACHSTQAPPLSLVYRRYLMLYSSKGRIAERMTAFLVRPTKKGSSMPEGIRAASTPRTTRPSLPKRRKRRSGS